MYLAQIISEAEEKNIILYYERFGVGCERVLLLLVRLAHGRISPRTGFLAGFPKLGNSSTYYVNPRYYAKVSRIYVLMYSYTKEVVVSNVFLTSHLVALFSMSSQWAKMSSPTRQP